MAQERLSDLRSHSRYITTHDASGKAIFSTSIPSPAPIRRVLNGSMEFSLMYTTTSLPISLSTNDDITTYQAHLTSPPSLTISNGTVCRTVDFPPGYACPMHRTLSCDFGVVIEGEMELVLDSGEKRVLKRGDVAVQRGTMHAWRNLGEDGWARMLFVLQAAEGVEVGGGKLEEDQAGID